MRFTFALLLALIIMPMPSLAFDNKTVVEAYQETLQKLEAEYEKLKRLTAEAKQKVAELETEANSIKTLIAKYEAALATTTQALQETQQAQLKPVKQQVAKLTETVDSLQWQNRRMTETVDSLQRQNRTQQHDIQSLQATTKTQQPQLQKQQSNIRALTSQLNKLTDAVSVKDGKVGIGTTSPGEKLHVVGSSYLNGNVYLTDPTVNGSGGSKLILASGMWAERLSIHSISANNYWTEFKSHTNEGWKWITGNDNVVRAQLWGGNGNFYVQGQVRADNVTVKSDERYKQNIRPLENALPKLQGLRGVSFKWKDNAQNANTQIGLIAQEVEKVLPELVSTDSDGYKSIAYGKLTAVLVEAIKAQQLQIERLSHRIADTQK